MHPHTTVMLHYVMFRWVDKPIFEVIRAQNWCYSLGISQKELAKIRVCKHISLKIGKLEDKVVVLTLHYLNRNQRVLHWYYLL